MERMGLERVFAEASCLMPSSLLFLDLKYTVMQIKCSSSSFLFFFRFFYFLGFHDVCGGGVVVVC